MIGLMYVMLIVPRQRELKRHNQLMTELDNGQEVMTTAGIYGTIRWIKGDRVGLQVADGVELAVAKRSIATRVEPMVDLESEVDAGADETGSVEE